MFTRTISKALLASAAAGFLTFALSPAQAQSEEPRSVKVQFGDLNLKSDAGKERLSRRIAIAARTVCGPLEIRDLAASQQVFACRDDAIATANRGLVQVFANAGNSVRVAAR
jgi:UrcA family protein